MRVERPGGPDAHGGRACGDAYCGGLPMALRVRTAHVGSAWPGAAWLKFFGHKNFRRVDPGRRSTGTPIRGGARPRGADAITVLFAARISGPNRNARSQSRLPA